MLYRLVTLGCKVNQYETEWVREGLRRLSWLEADRDEVADFVLINTCTVTAESDLKSRKLIRKLIDKNPGARVVVMGCSATRDPETIATIKGVDDVIPDKRRIPELLRNLGLTEIPTGISRFGSRHRAYVKAQDGCQVGCSYCIIPKIRPRLQSRPEREILDEIRRLSRNGYREIVLTGIHLGHYGMDFTQPSSLDSPSFDSSIDLARLVARIIDLPEPFRLRISSLEAVEVSDDLIDVMTANPDRICPHLHLSMQSGSDPVLRRMRRRWLSETFNRRCEEILRRFDRLALTTDVIVGFPGETDFQFEETCQAVRRLRFSKVHVFRFSPRKGTEAASFSDRIAPPIQKKRAEHLLDTAARLRAEYAASLVGSTLSVLLETSGGGTSDRYLEVRLAQNTSPDRIGRIEKVRITQVDGERLLGNLIES